MPQIIKLISHRFNYYLRTKIFTKIIFLPPKKNKILIYDDSNKLLSHILKKKSPAIFYNRLEEINIYIFLKSFFYFQKENISRRYALTYIKQVDPKIIVSNMDNNLSVYKLKKFFKDKKVIIIQNGIRSFENDFKLSKNLNNLKKLKLECDYFFVLSKRYMKAYSTFIKSKYIIIGSLASNSIKIKNKIEKKKIVFISQFSYIEGLKKYKNFFKADEIAFKAVLNFCVLNKLKLHIFLKFGSNREINYFKSLNYKKNKNLIFVKRISFHDKFKFLDNSELIISADSTLGYEMIARKKKVFLISIRDQYLNTNEKRNIFFGNNEKSYEKEGVFYINKSNNIEKVLLIKLNNIYKFSTSKLLKIYNQYKESLFIPDYKNSKFYKVIK